MEKDVATMFADFLVGKQSSEVIRLAKLLNYVSDHPQSEEQLGILTADENAAIQKISKNVTEMF